MFVVYIKLSKKVTRWKTFCTNTGLYTLSQMKFWLDVIVCDRARPFSVSPLCNQYTVYL